jgi:alpha-mannosidase
MPPFFDADWKVELLQLRARLHEIEGTIFSPRQPIGDLWRCDTGTGRGPESPPKEGWNPFQLMDRWGGLDQTTWFRMRAVVPPEFAGLRVVAILQPCLHTHLKGMRHNDESGETLAYVNGKPFQGIDKHHDFMVLSDKAKAGEAYDIALEGAAGTRYDMTHTFGCADLAVMNADAWEFYWDARVLMDVVEYLPEADTTRRRLFKALFAAVCMVDLQHKGEEAYWESLRRARAFLKAKRAAFPAGTETGALVLVGHSHIDTAWLWPLRETRRKVGRTFSTVLRLMERYPEYKFSASQPELYMFVKENHPDIYKQIKRRVKEGRWEICGAPWVEQDSQMPCGEALVRQFLYGNRFFEQEFGQRTHVAWLPDAFGFPWSLPQIMRKAQIETFFTTKLGWNRHSKFPHGYFEWQGADGTRIRALTPKCNYNGNPIPAELAAHWNDFPQRDVVEELPFSFGWGDGGGGASPRMLEYGRRMQNLTGVPRCTFGRVDECLDRMEAAAGASELPVWNGELYLELHRACQTTQARTKRNNRKCEWLLHDAELLSMWALLLGGDYEQEELRAAWRVLLTHQFHDILPGSSIGQVYADADENYAALRRRLEGIIARAATRMAGHMPLVGEGTPIIVWNTLGFEREDVAELRMPLPSGPFHIENPMGDCLPHQVAADGALLFETGMVPPSGYMVFRVVSGAQRAAKSGMLKASPKRMENDLYTLKLDAWGRFTSLYDKAADREVIAEGAKANLLQLFEDRPAEHDAWDFEYNFTNKMWEPDKPESVEVIEQGPVRAVVRVVRRTEHSRFQQDITLHALNPRIDVRCRVDWHEKRTLLKVAFPVDVLSPRATYDIQFAAVERPTHENTAADRARFEVTGHHWADLSEPGYGVSLINDCKYGYDTRGDTLRLSLLRAPVDPDPHADEGAHEFTYSLLPHEFTWDELTVEEGLKLNAPLRAFAGTPANHRPQAAPLPDFGGLLSTSMANVFIDSVKKAEDSDALIVRLHEALGERGPVEITFGWPPREVWECDLMEENDIALEINDEGEVPLYIKPFEIRTLKVYF